MNTEHRILNESIKLFWHSTLDIHYSLFNKYLKYIKFLGYFNFFLFIFLHSTLTQSQVYFNDLDGTSVDGNWIGLNTIDSVSPYSGFYYSKTDSIMPYGLGIEQPFPDELSHNNTMVIISGWVKSNKKNNNALFVITIVQGNETFLWKGIPLANIIQDKDIWHYFSDSILIPADLTAKSKLKAYLWNQDKAATTGIDDLRIEFRASDNPTFVPVLTDLVSKKTTSRSSSKLYANNYYSVTYDQNIKIYGSANDNIISNIRYYYKREVKGKEIQSQINWEYTKSSKINNGKKLHFKASDRNVKLNLVLICDNNTQEIQIIIEEKYKREQTVNRESLVFNYSQTLENVYRNNRKLDIGNFQTEYWLDKQGVKMGEGQNSLLIYHTPDISSLQLDTENKLLFANLDYEKDHPFFRFPLNPDSTDWRKEESNSRYKKGDKRKYGLKLFVGNIVYTLPRFMKNPKGYEATYIWTEHADYSDIRTNRATYFGSESISHPDSAIGGFVRYNIPVTKSVFYDNPDSVSNLEASKGVFTTLESTILTDSQFSEFLFHLDDKGSDICLHTPEQYTTTAKRLEEALFYMQTTFRSPSWIDHGNNNGPQNNREDLICDGTLEDSPYYAIDLWNKYGVKYLHNAYYEELNTFKDWQFESSLEKPYSGFGDFFPKPDYYHHPTRTSNLVHWPTSSALFVEEHYLWDYLFNIDKLRSLVENRAVEINHTYPAWVDPQKGMWTFDTDSTIVAQSGFNQALANMSELRNEGKLNVCTIKDFLDYRTAIDKVDYGLLPDGRILLTNNNDSDINGLTMVASAKAVTVNSLIPDQKTVDDEIIFWFDIGAGDSKIIRLVE